MSRCNYFLLWTIRRVRDSWEKSVRWPPSCKDLNSLYSVQDSPDGKTRPPSPSRTCYLIQRTTGVFEVPAVPFITAGLDGPALNATQSLWADYRNVSAWIQPRIFTPKKKKKKIIKRMVRSLLFKYHAFSEIHYFIVGLSFFNGFYQLVFHV